MIELKEQVKQLLQKSNQTKPIIVESPKSLESNIKKQHYEWVVRPILKSIDDKCKWITISRAVQACQELWRVQKKILNWKIESCYCGNKRFKISLQALHNVATTNSCF